MANPFRGVYKIIYHTAIFIIVGACVGPTYILLIKQLFELWPIEWTLRRKCHYFLR